MTKQRNTKKALLSSILSLVLCFTMLIGTTFAWFTDSVTSANNRIQSGTLKVDLLMDKAENDNYVSIANGNGDIFSEATGNGVLWEPGKTEIVYLAVENKGNLALKYNIVLDITDNGLAGALEYAIIDGAKASNLAAATKWADIEGYTGAQVGDMPTGRQVAAPNGKLEKEGIDYFALAVHMKEEAGNEYQNKDIEIDLSVVATQATVESDSFDNQYDKDAVYPIVNSAQKPSNSALEIKNNDVTVVIPEGAADGTYTFKVNNMDESVDASGNTVVTADLEVLLDGVKVQVDGNVTYTVKVNVGTNKNVISVKHNGTDITGYYYDPVSGILTFETASFSPFSWVVAPADDETIFVPSSPEVADKLEDETSTFVAVDEAGNEYATLKAAIDSGVSKIYCKPNADLGTITHLDVDHDLVIYGNGARISAGERDLSIDIYKKLTKDIEVTIYNLHGVGIWGQRNTNYTLKVNLYNCNDISRIYMGGTAGVNNINVYGCTATKDTLIGDTVIYSNANGKIVADGCTVTNIGCPVNLNHKVAGTQEVVVTNSTFVDCATEGTAAYYAPIRMYNSAEGAKQTLLVKGNSFTYSDGKAPINKADVLSNAKHNGVDAIGTIIAEVQMTANVVAGVNVDVTYQISNAEDLKAFAAAVNKYSNYERPFDGQTVKLMDDIDLGGIEWIPIGDYRFQANRFCGTFDGQGHTISNFKITKKTDKNDSNKSSYGFFGNMEGTVKNLTIDNANVCSYAYVGALVGRMSNGELINCHVKNSSVETTYWQAGGMIGQLNDNCKVSGCTITKTTVTGAAAIGGLIGPITATGSDKTLLFENCSVIDCAVVQKGSFGASYDRLFGAMFADVDVADNVTNINNCTVTNTTVKGENSEVLYNTLSGNAVYVDGVKK